jgi:NAD(P)-dependent dehydrogenase (short-subunit alcohol dehydrogenase family)
MMLQLPSSFDLTGRVALVTGARREIGRAIALGLAALGADIAVHHIGPAEAQDAAAVVREAEALGRRAIAFAADFAEPGAAGRLATEVNVAFGRADILVLNASIEIPETFGTISSATFDRQIAVNLRATLHLMQALVPAMAERGWGRVVTVGSVQQVKPHPDMFVYAGTKAAQHNWAMNLARQFARRGVTINNLAPGAIATARNRAQIEAEGAAMAERIPVGRLGRPCDLIGAAMLLCSDAGGYINGVDLFVDGGRAIA